MNTARPKTRLSKNQAARQNQKLSSFALKVLRKLDAGEKSGLAGRGAPVLGKLKVPGAVLGDLVGRGLVDLPGAGRAVINEAGRSHLRRLASEHRARSGAGGQISPHRHQHMLERRVTIAVDGAIQSARINLAESPLGWMKKRKGRDGRALISAVQYEAGERLRYDFEMAGLSPKVTGRYDGTPVARKHFSAYGGLSPGEAQIAAKKRYRGACDAMGAGLDDIAVRVCCFMEGFEAAESQMGWPARSGKVVLRIALDRLVDYYGLPPGRPAGK
jgi:Domain of unknown function (DUF6456)